MKSLNLFFLLAAASLVLLSSCGVSTKVHSTVDQTVNFKNFHSFAWLNDTMKSANSPYDNEVVRNNIRHFASQELEKLGYKLDTQSPDVLLQLAVHSRPVQETRRYTDYQSYSAYGYRLAYSPITRSFFYVGAPTFGYYPYSYAETATFQKSAVTINVINRASKKMIATVSGLTETENPKTFDKNLPKEVAKIIKESPLAKA